MDLKDLIEHMPPDSTSALWRARNPQSHGYSLTVQALMEVINRLEVGNWQRAGGPDGFYPEPWEIPGTGPEKEPPPPPKTATEIRALTAAQYN